MNQAAKRKRTRFLPLIILTLLGAGGGYAYYRFVGCASGACAITSNPYISTIYGGIIGALLGSSFTPRKRTNKEEENTNV